MNVADIGERALIERLRGRFGSSFGGVVRGIGDDTAVLQPTEGRLLLATTDAAIEGVHFILASTNARDLGWRSLAVNLSDVASMGGVPRWCLVSLGLPPVTNISFVDELAEGMAEEAALFDTTIVGGNLARSPDRLIIDITLLGEVEPARVLYRHQAQPGDHILVTGTLGDSAAGLAIILGSVPSTVDGAPYLVGRHRRPTPRVGVGRAISLLGTASAMIDLSDGLATDLGHIADESHVGARIDASRIPLSPEIFAAASSIGVDPLEWALGGGEDYELLFTVPLEHLTDIVNAVNGAGVAVTDVGEVTAAPERWLVRADGRREPLGQVRWGHFDT